LGIVSTQGDNQRFDLVVIGAGPAGEKAAAQAAWERGLQPRQISFAGTVQALAAFAGALIASAAEQRDFVYQALFIAIATHRVGDRPNRVEPRRLKRRIDKYPMLRQPRAQERAAILNGAE